MITFNTIYYIYLRNHKYNYITETILLIFIIIKNVCDRVQTLQKIIIILTLFNIISAV